MNPVRSNWAPPWKDLRGEDRAKRIVSDGEDPSALPAEMNRFGVQKPGEPGRASPTKPDSSSDSAVGARWLRTTRAGSSFRLSSSWCRMARCLPEWLNPWMWTLYRRSRGARRSAHPCNKMRMSLRRVGFGRNLSGTWLLIASMASVVTAMRCGRPYMRP